MTLKCKNIFLLIALLATGIILSVGAYAATQITTPASATSVNYGDDVTVEGTVTGGSTYVHVFLMDQTTNNPVFRMDSVPVDPTNNDFNATFTLDNAHSDNGASQAPYALNDVYDVVVLGENGADDSLTPNGLVILRSAAWLDESTKVHGQTLTVSGGGFLANDNVTVTVTGPSGSSNPITFQSTASTGSTGSFESPISLNEVNAADVNDRLEAGTYTVSIAADATTPIPGSLTFTVNNTAPTIGSNPTEYHGEIRAAVGSVWSYNVNANDVNKDPLQYSSPTTGVSYDSTAGAFTYTPTATGDVALTFVVTDDKGGRVERTETVKVYSEEYDQKLIIRTEPNIDKAEPGETTDFDVKLENTMTTSEMDNVVVTVIIDDLDIDIESDDIGINEDTRDDVNIEFKVPLDAEAKTDYEAVIEVEGEDDNGTIHKDVWVVPFEVERKDHKLLIDEVTVLPPLGVKCGSRVEVFATVYNIGDNVEDDVYLRVINSDLNVEVSSEKVDDLDETGSDQDYEFRTSFFVPKDAKEDKYYLSVDAISDDTSTSSIVELDVGKCNIGADDSSDDTSDNANSNDDGSSGGDVGGGLESESSVVIGLGQTTKLQTVLTNNDNTIRSYSLKLMGINNWAVGSVEPVTVTLGPNSAAPVYVYLTPRLTAGASETATLVVYSGDALISKQTFDVAISGVQDETVESNLSAGITKFTDYAHSSVVGASVSTLDVFSVAMLISSLAVLAVVLYVVKNPKKRK